MTTLQTYHITIRYQTGYTGTVPTYVEVDGDVDTGSIDELMIRLVTKGFPIPVDALPSGGFRINISDSIEGDYVPQHRIMWVKWELVP